MFIVPLHTNRCQSGSGPVCPQAILPMRVTPSVVLCVTNIPSINFNDWSCKNRAFLKSCPIPSPMLTKNVVRQCQQCFGVRKLSKHLSFIIAFINCFLHARCSLTVTELQKETHNAISFTELCFISPLDRKRRDICYS